MIPISICVNRLLTAVADFSRHFKDRDVVSLAQHRLENRLGNRWFVDVSVSGGRATNAGLFAVYLFGTSVTDRASAELHKTLPKRRVYRQVTNPG